MKKTYIAPNINVRAINVEENILAASEGAKSWTLSVDEDNSITTQEGVGAKRHVIDWDDEDE